VTQKTAIDVRAVVLAAGRSSRMGGPNKLMAQFSGQPLIRRTVERALSCGASGVLVVTGHQAERIHAALGGLAVAFAHNADFASGLAGSLRTGIAALPESADGALIALGDMPTISAADLERLISAFRLAGGQSIVRATHQGNRGNPLVLPRALFAAIGTLEGDTGARQLVAAAAMPVVDVEIGEGASIDVDTPDALATAGGVLQD